MKKIILILSLALISIATFAQEAERKSQTSGEEMATLGAKRLAMQLDLTAEQKSKLKELYLKRIEDRKERREERLEEREEIRKKRNEMRRERIEMSEEYKEEIKEILTEDQFTKWEQLQEKRRRGRILPPQKNN